MNVVLVMFKDEERREFPMAEEVMTLGRRQDCHLRIPTRDVSRRHCELLIEKRGLVVKDLGSSNGTFVNGKRIAETELVPGDHLRIGPVTFIVQINGKPADIKPEKGAIEADVTPTAGPSDDEDTFDLTDADFDLEDPISALDEPDEDEADMP
ncbi:MAG: FHA domain-containing protein [Phycisphaerae bacterium]|nr:FHA domain-containing protein [Phycisphaerae bacterium]